MIDIGKTLSKITLWSPDGEVVDRQTRPNATPVIDGIRRLDVDGIAAWLTRSLRAYGGMAVDHIIPVGHGAGVVVLGQDGPAIAPLDYEQPIPPDVMQRYRQERDGFSVTGSPALPNGLNIGAQLAWLETLYPSILRDTVLLPWAQYWAWFLSGHATSEVTSLGCHSDLWAPGEARFSDLAERKGWASRFAPLAQAGEVIGTLRPELLKTTGLPASAKVVAGLHDSNAALLAARGFDEMRRRDATILSTGTWFIAMRSMPPGMTTVPLAEALDCLINVDVHGCPVPSARFMGGREIETVIEIDTRRVDIGPDQPLLLEAVTSVLADNSMLLPTLAAGCGPFPDGEGRWINRPEDWHARRAAACLYAALVADRSLDLIGASDRLLVEGRFADAEVFVRALASLRPGMSIYTANAHNDVSFGALRLIRPELKPQGRLSRVEPLEADLSAYRVRWLDAADKAA